MLSWACLHVKEGQVIGLWQMLAHERMHSWVGKQLAL